MEGINNFDQEEISVKDPEEARELIIRLIEKGEKPCVSVPEKYMPALEEGLKPHSTWIQGFDAIIGTLGRKPYLPGFPENEIRRIVRINEIDLQSIQPRFTGPDNAFHGVVFLNGPINPGSFEVLSV